jgi:hypothetical protein
MSFPSEDREITDRMRLVSSLSGGKATLGNHDFCESECEQRDREYTLMDVDMMSRPVAISGIVQGVFVIRCLVVRQNCAPTTPRCAFDR